MTIISFKRAGGFVSPGLRFELDLKQLPAASAQYFIGLIRQAEFFNLPENYITRSKPEECQYTITVDVGVLAHTIRTNDTTMPAALRLLVDELTALKPAHQ
jgi:hypothetical protein